MKFSVYGETWASRIRQFWDDLFTSRHVRFLEAELARVRAEKDAEIQRLLAMPNRQTPKLFNEPPFIPPAVRTINTYEAALAEHNRLMQEEELKEKSNGIQKQ